MRGETLRALAGLALLAMVSTAAAAPLAVMVSATPIDRFDLSGQKRFGPLEFRGGMVLSSPSEAFGGISGMSLSADGVDLLAVTDKGLWLSGRIESEGDRPMGLGDVTMTPLVAESGRALNKIGLGDVESLTRTRDGYLVSIERTHEIWTFPGANPLLSRGKRLAAGGPIAELGSNTGLEALMFGPTGIISIAEQNPADPTTLPGFIFSPTGKPVGGFFIERIDEFSATDMALAADGRVYLLERRFDVLRGVALRVRRFPITDIKPGAAIRGEVLLEANRLAYIDNMEALAIHRNAAGETVLTMMSDDNFSPLQRTILLRFAVLD